MKYFTLVFLLLSLNAYSRQYIQCSNLDEINKDVMVVNLETEQDGTLFISSGMENPEDERLLLDIKLKEINLGFHQYVSVNSNNEAEVTLPSQIINKSSDSVNLELNFNLSFIGKFSSFNCKFNPENTVFLSLRYNKFKYSFLG